ncbi:hypothetical protein GBA52_022121 [Prunus armeniaca]|nr:hypothetical protein GBA52_022121 [Prunus armeniaca]
MSISLTDLSHAVARCTLAHNSSCSPLPRPSSSPLHHPSRRHHCFLHFLACQLQALALRLWERPSVLRPFNLSSPFCSRRLFTHQDPTKPTSKNTPIPNLKSSNGHNSNTNGHATTKQNPAPKSPFNYALKGMLLALLIKVYDYKEHLHPNLIWAMYCFHIIFCPRNHPPHGCRAGSSPSGI